MTAFLLGAAALTLVTLAALVLPLLRKRLAPRGATQADVSVAVLRDQLEDLERERASGAIDAAAFEAAQRNLKLRILEDSVPEPAGTIDRPHFAPAIVLAILLPAAAAGLYAWLGTPDAIELAQQQAQVKPQHAELGQMEAVVERLAQRLRASPDDPEGWAMLARSYRVMGRHQDAVAAYERAESRIASDPQRLSEWAESLAIVSGGTLAGKPAELVARALAVDPEAGHALALAGAAAFERKDWGGAIAHWERLAKQVPAGTEQGETVARSIAAARDEFAKSGGSQAAAPASPAKSAATAAATPAVAAARSAAKFKVSGSVSLAPALAAKASPDDTVFIFARAAEGPAMPIAVLRKRVNELPAEFTLDDSSAMMAEAQLADIRQVIVGARISRSGSAAARSGDLQGLSKPVKFGTSGIRIVIDAALP